MAKQSTLQPKVRTLICEADPVTDPEILEAISKRKRQPLDYALPQAQHLMYDLRPRHRVDLIWEMVKDLHPNQRHKLLRMMNAVMTAPSTSTAKANGKAASRRRKSAGV